MLEPEEVRRSAEAFARWAVGNSEIGVSLSSDVYRAVTQGRQDFYRRHGNVPYGSCGDLPNALRWALGIRRDVNRATSSNPRTMPDGTISGWRIGQNLVVLGRGENRYAVRPPIDAHFGAGDVLIIDDGVDDPARKDSLKTHALVVLEHTPTLLASADYGQPGGALCLRLISTHGGYYWLRDRRVWSWLDVCREYSGEASAGMLGESEAHPIPPEPGPVIEVVPQVTGVARPYVKSGAVTRAQLRLLADGFDCGAPDGYAGPRTTGALAAWALRELNR